MSETKLSISTRQAAKIFGVHESSVKRWCNSNLLPFSLTQGGHRRINFDDVIEFARSQSIDAPLLEFTPKEQQVWRATENALLSDFSVVNDMLYDELLKNDLDFAQKLTTLLIASGMSIASLFDNIYTPIVHRIGYEWSQNELPIGDEHLMMSILTECIIGIRQQFSPSQKIGRSAVVACVPSDEHELGAQMIRAILEHMGWKTIYLGRKCPAEDIASQQQKRGADLVCVSAVPPQGPADVAALVRTLERMYDSNKPYRLAIGGGKRNVHNLANLDSPFQAVARLGSIAAFQQWVENSDIHQVTRSNVAIA